MSDLIKRDDALLPCPFCGGEPTISASPVDQVSCENHSCPADVVSFDGFSTIEAAIAAWNKRVLPALTPNPVDDSKTADPVVNDPAAIRDDALRDAYKVVYKWWFDDGNELPQELIFAMIGEKK